MNVSASRSLTIGIDASSAVSAERTGVAKLVGRLIEHLEAMDDANKYVIYHRLSRWKNREYFYRPKRATTKVKVLQEPFFTGRGIDVFHGPDARLPKIRGPRLVATVNDLFSLVSDEFADEKFRSKKIERYRDIARRADRIICISESTRRDFIRFFPDAEPRTCVIYAGVDEIFYRRSKEEIERVRKKLGVRSDYILYVGALSKRKNMLRMFDAFRQARHQMGEDLQFVAVGRLTYGGDEILRYIEDNRCADQILLPGYVPDRDLPAIYSGARLLLFATLYEGFGMPILEALACGTPVVTSNVSSSAEIAGDAACLVNPMDQEEIVKGLLLVLNGNKPVGADFPSRAPQFKWPTMATETLSVYQKVGLKRAT